MVNRTLWIPFAIGCALVSSCSTLHDSAAPHDSAALHNPATEQDPTIPIAIADPLTKTLAVYLGGRSFREDLEPAEDHSLVGIEYATQTPAATVGWEFGIQYSENVLSGFDFSFFGSTTLDASSLEFYGGVRKTFREESAFRPYVGGGLSVLKVELDLNSFSSQKDSSSVLGLYMHAGATYAFNPTFALGLDYRILIAQDAKLFGFATDVDYGQLALTLAFRF